jgi:cysteine desulfurase
MKKVYLDNAATTPLRLEVIQEMQKSMLEDFGNPSSSHSFGRHSKNSLELARKNISKILNASSQEIIFTSGATEANNWVLKSAVSNLKIKRIVTSKVEHHAVLHAVELLKIENNIEVCFVNILKNGEVDFTHLVQILNDSKPTLVSLMHVNNETGVVLNLEKTIGICKQHSAYFHTDTVQSIGKIKIDLQVFKIDFLVASAHKFHGPKGIGFVYVRKGLVLNPIFQGGEQEKGSRPGTESIHNIVGMSKALELANENYETEIYSILELKKYCIQKLLVAFPEAKINGEATLHTILNIVLPFSEEKTAMILFNLDMKGIAVSRGSACQSGSNKPSHVLFELLSAEDLKKPSLRISFSFLNTKSEIDYLVNCLEEINLI